jgi:hypothetical protein
VNNAKSKPSKVAATSTSSKMETSLEIVDDTLRRLDSYPKVVKNLYHAVSEGD